MCTSFAPCFGYANCPYNLVNSFHQRDIHFKPLDLGIDTTTPAGKFMLSIFASLVECDRESLLEKTKAGQQLAAAQGKYTGRPRGLDADNLTKLKKGWNKACLRLRR